MRDLQIGVWKLSQLGVLTSADAESLEPAQRLVDAHSGAGPIDLSDGFVAVGGLDGSVNLHAIAGEFVQDRRIRLAEPRPAGDKTTVMAVSFSPDGGMLAASWSTGEVAVFSTASTARLASFQQDDCTGILDMIVLAFSTDGSRLAAGGGTCKTVRIHQIAPVRPPRFSIADSTENLRAAAVSEDRVALVVGSRVMLQTHGGDVVADIKTGEVITCNCNVQPLALRPSGEHVAVVLATKSVAVYDVRSGKLAFPQLEDFKGMTTEVTYSPDGTLLLVSSLGGGVYVFDAATGTPAHTLTDKPDYEMAGTSAVDPASKTLFAANFTGEGGLVVTDLQSGRKTMAIDTDLGESGHKLAFPCVDDVGDRLAYARIDGAGNPYTIIRSLGETDEEIKVIDGDKEVGLAVPKGFSRGEGNLLLQTTFEMEETATSYITVYDCEKGEEAQLSQHLPIMLGAGFTAHNSVGWVPSAPSPTIHATVGSELVFVELDRFEAMMADGCFGAQLLMDLSGDGASDTIYQPQMIDAIVKRFPDCISAPSETGDTVLHHCARDDRLDAVRRWLPRGSGIYTPVSSGPRTVEVDGEDKHYEHWTALHEAIYRNNKDIALHFLATLTKSTNTVTSALVSDAMTLMAMLMSHLVHEAMKLLDEQLMLKEGTRTPLS